MPSYRYRTATLLGPWRATIEAAAADAIRSKQARRDEDGAGWHWLVPGSIEAREMASPPGRPVDDFQLAASRQHGDPGDAD